MVTAEAGIGVGRGSGTLGGSAAADSVGAGDAALVDVGRERSSAGRTSWGRAGWGPAWHAASAT